MSGSHPRGNPPPPPAADDVTRLRRQVSGLHQELVRYQLVVWTAGNVSGRVPGRDLFVIKPSGVDYDRLTPENMIVCDLDGAVVEGDLSPSSDTAAHAYVYRHMPEVGGVVHTHSTYACAWAARGEPVPCVLTAMADEFGSMARSLSKSNCRSYVTDLPQDVDVISVEPIRRKVSRPHTYLHVA